MNIKNSSKIKSKRLSLLIAALVIIAILVASYAFLYRPKGETKTTSPRPVTEVTSEQIQGEVTTEQSKSTALQNDADTTGNPASSKRDIEVIITSATQSGPTLQVRTLVHTIASEGSCRISLEQSGAEVFSEQSAIQALPNSTTCSGFNLDVSSLARGEVLIKVIFQTPNLSGTAQKKVVLN